MAKILVFACLLEKGEELETPICRTHRSNADKSTTRGDVAIVAISRLAIRYGLVARLDYVNIKSSKTGEGEGGRG
jgi:hypothetical protein